jgi:hypothetical protein
MPTPRHTVIDDELHDDVTSVTSAELNVFACGALPFPMFPDTIKQCAASAAGVPNNAGFSDKACTT